jgi:hypothetical protein
MPRKQMPPANSRNSTTYVHINAGSMPVLEKTFAATASAPILNLVGNMHQKHRTNVAAIGSIVSKKPARPGYSSFVSLCATAPSLLFVRSMRSPHQLTSQTKVSIDSITARILDQ